MTKEEQAGWDQEPRPHAPGRRYKYTLQFLYGPKSRV